MKNITKSIILVGFLTPLVVTHAFGAPLETVFTGTTVGQPTWNRPLRGNPPSGLSVVGTAVPFSAQTFFADQTGSYNFLSEAISPVKWDNFSFLYAGTFNPLSQFNNILIGNDDLNNDIGLIGQSGFTYNLTANSPYVLVITGYDNTHAGSFKNTIRGPGRVQAGSSAKVPEAGSILPIFGLVLAGLGLCKRRLSDSKSLSA